MKELILELSRYKNIVVEETKKDLVFTSTDDNYNVDLSELSEVTFGELLHNILSQLNYDPKKIRDTSDNGYIKLIQKLQLKER